MKGRVSWITAGFLSLWLFSNSVMAAEAEKTRPSDMDLIEFLGGWESDDGAWIDPAFFDDIFTEDSITVEEESILRAQDLRPSKTQQKGDPSLEDDVKGSVSEMRKEER